jgi:nitroreductase
MNVKEALWKRRTVRAFLADPVSRETLEAILGDALRAPSWANTQPWEIFVAAGEPLERIRAIWAERTDAKVSSDTDLPFPGAWPEGCRERSKELNVDRANVTNTTPADPAFHREFLLANRRFFAAPCVVWVCMDQMLGSWSMFDLGALSQSICLAAQDHGVDSAIAINMVLWPDVLREDLQIPRELAVVIGIALGYVDPAGPEDAFRAARRPLGDVVRFVGI